MNLCSMKSITFMNFSPHLNGLKVSLNTENYIFFKGKCVCMCMRTCACTHIQMNILLLKPKKERIMQYLLLKLFLFVRKASFYCYSSFSASPVVTSWYNNERFFIQDSVLSSLIGDCSEENLLRAKVRAFRYYICT